MEQFIGDVADYILSYYNTLVALLPKLVLGLAVMAFFWLIGSQAKRLVQKRLFRRIDDPLLADFLGQAARAALITLGVLGLLQVVGLGKAASSLLAGAGISAFVIGFAFKDIGENFLAGILMAFKRPFRIGDIIEVGSIKGKVTGLTLRDTQVKTFDGKDVYIPNGQILKNPIINYTIDGFLRQEFTVGIDYGASASEAIVLILQALERVPGILKGDKPPSVMVQDLGASALNLTVYYWLDTFEPSVSGVAVRNQAVEEVLGVLSGAGIYLPGEVLEVKNYQDAPLLSRSAGS